MCRQYDAEDLAEIPFRFGDEESALALAQGLYDLQHSLRNVDLDALDAVTAAFRGDILTNLGHEPTRRPELVFWLIVCASFPMRLGVDRRRLDLLRRWAILSSVEDYLLCRSRHSKYYADPLSMPIVDGEVLHLPRS